MRIGNRVTEKDIRDWLIAKGFDGKTALIKDLELFAIQRPGWLQVFSFEVLARQPADQQGGQSDELEDNPRKRWFGIVRDDERNRTQSERTQIQIFDSLNERDQQLAVESEGLLTTRTGQSGSLAPTLVILATIVLFAIAVSILS